jgi:hypothetical protein
MGGTVNATDNFKAPEASLEEVVEAIESGKGATLNSENQVVVLDSLPSVTNEHVHGPGCGHDHGEAKEPMPVGKYQNPDMIPELNLVASFEANNSGPIWKKTAQEYLTNIAFQAASVPENGARLCFMNNEAYKFLLAHPSFRKRFTPAAANQQKKGIVGLFDTHLVLVCDALWEQGEQLTLHKAIYFTDEVLAPVTEVLIETRTEACVDEGCPEHGSEHVHPVGAEAEAHVHTDACSHG